VTTVAPVAPPVIHLASGERSAAGGAAPSAAPAAEASTADSKMAIWAPTEYVYDGDIPALDGPAASWFFAPGQQPDPTRLAAIAASLGATGDLRQLPQDQGGGWAIGPEDYSAPVLTVGSDGMLSWWLSGTPASISAMPCAMGSEPAPGAGVAGSSGTATDVVAPDTVPPDQVEPTKVDPSVDPACTPQPPANVPSKDEALAKAKELFTSWGYDTGTYVFDEPYADEWGASVNAWLTIDGMRTPVTLSVGFGENGAVTWASGSLAEAQRGADYPTIGAAAGLERLKSQQDMYRPMAAEGVATDAVAPPADNTAGSDAASGTAVAEPGVAIAPVCDAATATDCGPVDTTPITVTLTSVKRDLTMVWAQDNTVWLLPAYSFGSADGGVYTVMAVDDAYIEQPPADTVDTGGTVDAGGSVDSGSGAATPPVDATAPAATPAP
jgi:hypothetical protein